MLGWRHAFGDTTPISTHAFAGSEVFSIAGIPIARDAAPVEAGLQFDLSSNAILNIAYQGSSPHALMIMALPQTSGSGFDHDGDFV